MGTHSTEKVSRFGRRRERARAKKARRVAEERAAKRRRVKSVRAIAREDVPSGRRLLLVVGGIVVVALVAWWGNAALSAVTAPQKSAAILTHTPASTPTPTPTAAPLGTPQEQVQAWVTAYFAGLDWEPGAAAAAVPALSDARRQFFVAGSGLTDPAKAGLIQFRENGAPQGATWAPVVDVLFTDAEHPVSAGLQMQLHDDGTGRWMVDSFTVVFFGEPD